jgi:hypothetical protein
MCIRWYRLQFVSCQMDVVRGCCSRETDIQMFGVGVSQTFGVTRGFYGNSEVTRTLCMPTLTVNSCQAREHLKK